MKFEGWAFSAFNDYHKPLGWCVVVAWTRWNHLYECQVGPLA